jgi:hypothetical protein
MGIFQIETNMAESSRMTEKGCSQSECPVILTIKADNELSEVKVDFR